MSSNRQSLLHLYRKLLRSCETFPSKKRNSIHQAIREEFRCNAHETDSTKIETQISVAIKGLQQLQQYTVERMTMSSGGGGGHPTSWTVHLEQNPMPKPADYDERRNQTKKSRKE